ncbi:11482_t:CDS:10, partial [Ambispora leptoticha]
MDFYKHRAVEDWTCEKLVEFYRATSGQKDRRKVLDSIKKDLKKVKETNSEFDTTRKRKAQRIVDNWKQAQAVTLGLHTANSAFLFIENWTTMGDDTGFKFEFSQIQQQVLANTVSIDNNNNKAFFEQPSSKSSEQYRAKSGREYSESISNSSEEDHVDDETHKRSKRKVGGYSEGLQESTEDVYVVSEHVPCFGLNFNEDLNHINWEILEIYNNAEQCDPIKMGVINLEDLKKNQTRAFKVISEMFKKDFRDNNIDSKMKTMLREIRGVSDISDAKDFVSKYIEELLSFDFDIASVTQSFIVSIVHAFTSYFSLDETYFQQSLSENHIASITHIPIFMNLFRSKNYLVNINSVLTANKDRRNSENDSRTRLGLIPDIKVIYSKRSVEIIVVEHAKSTSSEGRKKNIDDTKKIIGLMHDQITKIYKLFEDIERELEVRVYVMHLSAPELYLFYKIFSYELPKTVYDFDVLSCLTRFRYNSILRKEPLTPTQQIQWVDDSSSRKQTAIKEIAKGSNSSSDSKGIGLKNSPASSCQPIPRTNPNKMECLYQYAVEHGLDPKNFSVITKAEKDRWTMGCFRDDLERDICCYQGGIKRKEDSRKYHKFLTDRDRLIGEELLRR